MKYRIFVILALIVTVATTSCVSKKKYLEMESFKQRAENRVRELTDENTAKDKRIETMIADFELMKGELMESNVIKKTSLSTLFRAK